MSADVHPTPVLAKVEATHPMLRQLNHDLAVHWINARLEDRASFDVRRDIILYDDTRTFVAMLPIVIGPELTPEVQRAIYEIGVRSYSVGIV